MILHSDRKGNDCIRKLRCHCIQILHSDIYSVHCGKMEGENAGGTNQAMPLPWWMEALKIRGGFWQSMLHSPLLLWLCSLYWELRVSAELRIHTIYFYKKQYWAARQQISWIIAPWWIFISFLWPSCSLLLPAPSSWLERRLHFASINLCQASGMGYRFSH